MTMTFENRKMNTAEKIGCVERAERATVRGAQKVSGEP